MKLKTAAFLLACTGTFAVVACSSGADAPAPYRSTNGSAAGVITLHEGTSALGAELADVADVRADRVVFPGLT